MRKILLVVALLVVAGCGKKKPVAPVVPAAPVVKRPRKPVPPKAPPVPAPAPLPIPPAPRAPVTLQSSADPLPDRATIEARLRDTQGMLIQLNSRTSTGAAKADSDRAASMLTLAQAALGRGDLRQANDLSLRASALAKTVLNAK